jgi:hypothetical protein
MKGTSTGNAGQCVLLRSNLFVTFFAVEGWYLIQALRAHKRTQSSTKDELHIPALLLGTYRVHQ